MQLAFFIEKQTSRQGWIIRGWKAAPIFSLSYLSVMNSRTALPLAARSVLLAFRRNFMGQMNNKKQGLEEQEYLVEGRS